MIKQNTITVEWHGYHSKNNPRKRRKKNCNEERKNAKCKRKFQKMRERKEKKENEKRKRNILPAAGPLDPTLTSMFVKLLQPSGLIKITT